MVNNLKDHEIPRNIYTVGLHISWTEKDQETVNSFLPILLSVWLLKRYVSPRATRAPHPWIRWVWSPLVIMNVSYIHHRFRTWEGRVRHISVLATSGYQYLINCTIHLQIVKHFCGFLLVRIPLNVTLRSSSITCSMQHEKYCSSSWIMMFCCFGVKVLRVHFTFWRG